MNADTWMVTCDDRPVQRAMSRSKADAFCELMQQQADYSHGTKIRNSRWDVKRDVGVIQEEDALYKAGKRRTLVVRP
jgi:hypothetical protein